MNLEDLDPKTYSDLYLWAASHYLSSWPQEWCGEKLANVMLSEEGDDDLDKCDSQESKGKWLVWAGSSLGQWQPGFLA